MSENSGVMKEVCSNDLLIDSEFKISFVHFELSNISGDNIILHGKIPMMRPPEDYKLPDPNELEFGVEWVEKWMISNKLIYKHEAEKRSKTRSIARDMLILSSTCFPEENKVTDTRTLLGVAANLLVIVFDDLVEESNLLGRNQAMGLVGLSFIDQLLKGKLDFYPDKNLPPLLARAAKVFQQIIKQTESFIPNFHENNSYFSAAVKATCWATYLLQVAGAKCTEEGEGSNTGALSEDMFTYLRRSDAAGRMSIEIMLLIKEVVLIPEIRENLFFKRYMEIAEEIIGHLNDLIGLEKDVKNKEWNIVLFKAKKNRISLEQSFLAVVQLLETLTKEFAYLESTLRQMYPECEDLEEFFEVVYSHVDGNGYLQLYTERHGDLRTAFTKLKSRQVDAYGQLVLA